MKNVYVSVIMPTYNRRAVISQAIDSVLNQSFGDFELLIMDDGSEDDTEQVVEAYKDGRIHFFKGDQRLGAAFRRNQGMAKAQGVYFAFLDTDNIWNRDYLKSRIHCIEALNADLVFGCVEKWEEEMSFWPTDEMDNGIIKADELIYAMCINNLMDTNSVLLKRTCYQEVGGFDTTYERLQDWEYFYRIAATRKYRIAYDHTARVRAYMQPDSISKNKQFWEMRVRLLKNQVKEIHRLGAEYDVMDNLWLCQEDGGFQNKQFDAVIDAFYQAGQMESVKRVYWELLKTDRQSIQQKDNEICNLNNEFQGSIRIIDRDNHILACYENWMRKESEGAGIDRILQAKGVSKIAVYGMGYLGRSLVEKLKRSEIKIACIIDKNKQVMDTEILCVSKLDQLELINGIDMVVVTAVNDFDAIYAELSEYVNIPVISLDQLF